MEGDRSWNFPELIEHLEIILISFMSLKNIYTPGGHVKNYISYAYRKEFISLLCIDRKNDIIGRIYLSQLSFNYRDAL